MEVKRNGKKARAALIAGTLAGAIALTGTLAWINMTQEAANEFVLEKNPGGRIHDDFNGLANKDIYAENFTDEDTGAPVFVRVKFLEYMEIGEEAGINRNPAEGTERKATPLLEGADINDTSTWFLHKPDPDPDAPVDPAAPAAVKDPFHEYWKWDQDGSTIYMPTFNKNKDSITPEVNGTYVGTDDDFETGRPYDDYVTYADGKTVTADAYYDVDGDDIDENYGKNGDEDFHGIPGAGGENKADGGDDPDYEVKNEEHTAHSTLNSLGVMTMAEWKAAKGPMCNKWIWDSDGWFYWPLPVQPQTATGLLLDKVSQVKTPSEKCYYAIDVVGQFVSTDGDWGTPDPATGFYEDGFTDDAKDMLEKAASILEVNGKRYLPLGQNLFQEILGEEGTLGDPICGGEDKTPNTDDDRTDVLYVEAGVSAGTPLKDYGKYFLKPRPEAPYNEPYYRAPGGDDLLGTGDDDRLWSLDGAFPGGTILDKIGDSITVAADPAATQVEVTHTQQFTAQVMLGDEVLTGKQGEVNWSVTAADGSDSDPGTTISGTGLLTVGEDETAAALKITATSKLDSKLTGSCEIGVIGKLNVKITAVNESGTPATSVPAGKTLTLKAQLCRGQVPEVDQPTNFTWSVAPKARTVSANTLTVTPNESDKSTATLTTSRDITTDATVTVTCDECPDAGTLDITITSPETVTLTVAENSNKNTVDAGGELNYTATFSDTSSLITEAVTWSVGTSTNNGATVTKVEGVEVNNGVVSVADTYVIENTAAGDTFYVKADADDTTTNAQAAAKFTVLPPTKIEVKVQDGGKAELAPGGNLQLEAVVKRGDTVYASDKVTWTFGGNGTPLPNTGISETGLLTFDENATIGVTVTATSVNDPSVSGTLDVKMYDGTVTYDNQKFYVLYTDETNGRQLILSKYLVKNSQKFASNTSRYMSSSIKDWLTSTWLEGRTDLKAAIWTDPITGKYATISTRTESGTWDEEELAVFLLSEADVFGTFSNSTASVGDYTVQKDGVGVQLDAPGSPGSWEAKIENESYFREWWLRSLRGRVLVSSVNPDGNQTDQPYYDGIWVRPALWVKIPTE